MAAMRRGDFSQSFRISDEVLAALDRSTRDDPALPYHLRWVWDGRPYVGCDVLVRCYHGLGDTLQFARYLPVLRSRVASLTVEVQPELIPVLASVPGVDRWVPFVLGKPLKPFECDLEIMELPHALRLAPDAVPLLDLGIRGDQENLIGLCWASGGWDLARDVPADLIAPLASGTVSLQPCATNLPVENPEGCPRSILETAKLVARLRLVITVDTMVAHLAGSLHRPTWLLLKHNADWRWLTERTDSPWYPSMRLFRQPEPGSWDAVITEVTAALGTIP